MFGLKRNPNYPESLPGRWIDPSPLVGMPFMWELTLPIVRENKRERGLFKKEPYLPAAAAFFLKLTAFRLGTVAGSTFKPILLTKLLQTGMAEGAINRSDFERGISAQARSTVEQYRDNPGTYLEWMVPPERIGPLPWEVSNRHGIDLGEVSLDVVTFGVYGALLATRLPEISSSLWQRAFEDPKKELWDMAVNHGLAIPPSPHPIPLSEAREAMRAAAYLYAEKSVPDLVEDPSVSSVGENAWYQWNNFEDRLRHFNMVFVFACSAMDNARAKGWLGGTTQK